MSPYNFTLNDAIEEALHIGDKLEEKEGADSTTSSTRVFHTQWEKNGSPQKEGKTEQRPKLVCDYCRLPNHLAKHCRRRIREQAYQRGLQVRQKKQEETKNDKGEAQ